MEEDLIYWIWLTIQKGIGPVKQHSLLKEWGTPKQILEYLSDEKGIPEAESLIPAERILSECEQKRITMLILGRHLPCQFREYEDLPVLLYKTGTDVPLTGNTGIVGARRCTQSGKRAAIEIAEEQIRMGKGIVSGMAKGIDAYAQTAAIKAGGRTLGVLGHGLDLCYPKEHEKLKEAITEQGMLVSEYPPGTPPRTYSFPRRNRIIAALSEELFVIDAKEHSGTITTVEAAVKMRKRCHHINTQYVSDE